MKFSAHQPHTLRGSLIGFFLVLAVSAWGAEKMLEWKPLPDLPDPIGVAGPFVGAHKDALIVAGGANFPVPAGGDLWEVPKVYRTDAWVLVRNGESFEWKTGFKLKKPVAYGMCISTEKGVVCIGGQTGESVYSEVFRLEWNPKAKTFTQTELPSLPARCTGGAAATVGDFVYVAGGQSGIELETATKNLWRLDLSKANPKWEQLPGFPGRARAYNQLAAQHNGREMCLYLMGGRYQKEDVSGDAGIVALADVYEFSPSRYASGKGKSWRKRKSAPKPIMAGTAVSVGQSHVFVVGGADGELLKKVLADENFVKRHPGFPKRAWAYHTITDTWVDAGPLPANHVTTPAVKWGRDIIIASGEIKPRVRSTKVWRYTVKKKNSSFGPVNFTVLILYLLAMVGVGVWFMRKNKSTDDYFRGGQNIPWWAAALRIVGTNTDCVIKEMCYSTWKSQNTK